MAEEPLNTQIKERVRILKQIASNLKSDTSPKAPDSNDIQRYSNIKNLENNIIANVDAIRAKKLDKHAQTNFVPVFSKVNNVKNKTVRLLNIHKDVAIEALRAEVKEANGSDEFRPICDSEGFYQHYGECWNDSLQMLFLFGDGFKEIVQGKMRDLDVTSAVMGNTNIVQDLKSKLEERADNLKLWIQDEEGESLKKDSADLATITKLLSNANFEKSQTALVIKYLKAVQRRFFRHYLVEMGTRNIEKELGCNARNKDQFFEKLTRLEQIYRNKGLNSTDAATVKLLPVKSGINLRALAQKSQPRGGNDADRSYLATIYNHVFFDRKLLVSNDLHFDKSESAYEQVKIVLADILQTDNKPMALIATILGHVVLFYSCGYNQLYYDDSAGIVKFPWRKFFRYILDNSNEYADYEQMKIWMGASITVKGKYEYEGANYPFIVNKGKVFTYDPINGERIDIGVFEKDKEYTLDNDKYTLRILATKWIDKYRLHTIGKYTLPDDIKTIQNTEHVFKSTRYAKPVVPAWAPKGGRRTRKNRN